MNNRATALPLQPQKVIICLILLFSSLGGDWVFASDKELKYIPIIFYSNPKPILTGLCLSVTEYAYPQTRWWENSNKNNSQADKSFIDTLKAIKQKNASELLELSHPTYGRDLKLFKQQSDAYFKQFEKIEVLSTSVAYSFDGFYIFYAKLTFNKKTAYAPFVFALTDEGEYKFLPYRTEKLSYVLVDNWFNSEWGKGKTETPAYCKNESIANATHKYALSTKQDSSHLYLDGFGFDSPQGRKELTERFITITNTIANSVKPENKRLPDIQKIADLLFPDEADKFLKWYASATDEEKSSYLKSFENIKPLFLFDAYPLSVLYVSTNKGVQAMYFISDQNEKWIWANAFLIAEIDKLFKSDTFYKSALNTPPFSNFSLNK